MIKKCAILLILLAAAPALFSETYISAGAGLDFSSQNFETASTALSSVNVNLHTFFGDRFGFLGDLSILFPLSVSISDIQTNLDLYETRWGLEALFGLGLVINIDGSSKLIAGGGLHLSSLMLSPETGSLLPSTYYYVIGPGFHLSYVYRIGQELFLRAGITAGIGLAELSSSILLSEYQSGFSFIPSIGIGAAF